MTHLQSIPGEGLTSISDEGLLEPMQWICTVVPTSTQLRLTHLCLITSDLSIQDGIASKLAVDLFALQDASPPGRAWYGTATRLRYLPMTSFAMRFNGRILQVCPFSVSALVPCSSPQLALLHSYYESRHMSIGESFLRC